MELCRADIRKFTCAIVMYVSDVRWDIVYFNSHRPYVKLVDFISLHILVFPSLTRCGTTAAIDPVCEQVTSESSVLLNVTHGEVGYLAPFWFIFILHSKTD